MDINKKIAPIVKKRIETGKQGAIYFVNSFSDLQNDQTVTKALQRLSEEGFLIRLSLQPMIQGDKIIILLLIGIYYSLTLLSLLITFSIGFISPLSIDLPFFIFNFTIPILKMFYQHL